MRQNPHVRICGGPGSATTLVYPTARGRAEDAAGGGGRAWSSRAAPATNACTSVSQGRMSRRISPARPPSVNSVRDVPQVDARMFYVWSPLHAQYWSVL